MLVKIAKEVADKYPQIQVAYVVARFKVKADDAYTELLKSKLESVLNSNEINKSTYETHVQIVNWRNVFNDMGKNYKKTDKRSSLEALVKRIVTGKKMFNVSDVVDLYNSCSVLSMSPMGAYDLEKIKSNIYLRYGRDGETFEGLGKDDVCNVEKNQIVYADDERVLTWLWNYRDSTHTAISMSTTHAIFFIDTAYAMTHLSVNEALQVFEDGLAKLGIEVTSNGILSAENLQVALDFEKPTRTVSSQPGILDKILQGHISINLQVNLSDKPNVNQSKSQKNKSPTSADVKNKKDPVVEQVNFKFKGEIDQIATAETALHAAATGNSALLKAILEHKPNLTHVKDWSESTLLMHAAIGDHLNVIELLLADKTNNMAKEKNINHESALDLAKRFNSTNAIKKLQKV